MLFQRAEEILINRRRVIRKKKVEQIKMVIDKKNEFDQMDSRVTNIIEQDIKFFGIGSKNKEAIEINKI